MKQHDDSRKGSFSSGGQRIDSHSFWGGGPSKESVLAKGVKEKSESSAQGAGSLSRYQDTTEEIKKSQMHGIGKIHSHPLKDNNRN